MHEQETAIPVEVKRGLVAEAREIFGVQAARELWVKLGLPGVPPVGEVAPRREPQTDWPRYVVRMPQEIRNWLGEKSVEHGTSVNTEILKSIRLRMEASGGAQIGVQGPAAGQASPGRYERLRTNHQD